MRVVLNDVWKSIGFQLILDNVSCEIIPGTCAAVLGVNGAGKSTLLRCLAAQVIPNGGAILMDGELFNRKSLALRKRLHLVPDTPLYPPTATVLQYLELVLSAYDRIAHVTSEQVLQLIDEMNLRTVALQPMSSLSRGQVYKTALIGMILLDCDLWLCDEPFSSGLDPVGMNVFRKYSRAATARGKTLIYTTQLPEIAGTFADQIIVLHKGRVELQGQADHLTSRTNTTVTLNEFFESVGAASE